jgi:methylenetetrahydrofolate reductase (NADPH)
MKIIDLFNRKNKVVSLEIFPPNKRMNKEKLYKIINELTHYSPDFISVTYGAAGNLHYNETIEVASYIKDNYDIVSMPHLTCITSTKNKIQETLDLISKNNLDNVLALRGDLPSESDFEFPTPLHFEYASDLIKTIRESRDLCIGAACYPEGHPDSKNLLEDIQHLKFKCDQGADFLVTQLFYDNQAYYKFYDLIRKQGINIPVTIGVMPVTNAKQIKRIVALSGATVPQKLQNLINTYENDPVSMFSAGIDFAGEQINQFYDFGGFQGIHLYVMNKPEVAEKIMPYIKR